MASRLAATERADKNIDDLLETLDGTCRRVRQTEIGGESSLHEEVSLIRRGQVV